MQSLYPSETLRETDAECEILTNIFDSSVKKNNFLVHFASSK